MWMWVRLVSSGPVLHILPYSKLQMPNFSLWLRELNPDLIIADECHKLANYQTATTSRFVNYCKEHKPKVVAYSGTLSKDSIRDFAHIAAITLGDGSPVPLHKEHIEDWAGALDSRQNCNPGALFQLCKPGQHVRDAFKERVSQTPGVITTQAPSVSVGHVITRRLDPELPTEIQEALQLARDSWERPDEKDFDDALEMTRCCRELACGLYNRWWYPRGEAESLIRDWLAKRKLWFKELRGLVRRRLPLLDSENLVTLAVQRHCGQIANPKNLPTMRSDHWQAWSEIQDQVKPSTESVRLSDYIVNDAADWALKNRGIVWYTTDDFGSWLSQISGLPKHGGGIKAPQILAKEKGDRSIIASVKSHGTGRNGLQYLFNRQLIAQSPDDYEQLIGRQVRPGQMHNVQSEVYLHTPELLNHFNQSIAKALSVSQTLGSKLKLLTGIGQTT